LVYHHRHRPRHHLFQVWLVHHHLHH
jgi:hypothetical protein